MIGLRDSDGMSEDEKKQKNTPQQERPTQNAVGENRLKGIR